MPAEASLMSPANRFKIAQNSLLGGSGSLT